jgi:hypothetical protein
MNQELFEAVRQEMAGLSVAAVPDLHFTMSIHTEDPNSAEWSNLGHGELALEPPSYSVIDTLGLAPRLLDAMIPVRLMPPANSMIRVHNSVIIELSAARWN